MIYKRIKKINLRKVNAYLMAFAGLCLIILTIWVYSSPELEVDLQLSKHIQAEINDGKEDFNAVALLTFISVFGNHLLAPLGIVVFAALFYAGKLRKEALFTLYVTFADILNYLFKLLIHRPRPTSESITVMQVFNHPSFPSGHVVHYVVLFGFVAVMLFYRRLFIWPLRVTLASILLFLIASVSLSRVYLGAHWVTDVVGGYLFGFLLLSFLLMWYFKTEQKKGQA